MAELYVGGQTPEDRYRNEWRWYGNVRFTDDDGQEMLREMSVWVGDPTVDDYDKCESQAMEQLLRLAQQDHPDVRMMPFKSNTTGKTHELSKERLESR